MDQNTFSPPNPNYGFRKKRHKYDNAVLGLLIGLVVPTIAVVFLYFILSKFSTFSNYLKMFIDFNSPTSMTTAGKMISLSLIANLLPFYFFLNRKRYLTIRGIFVAMFLLGVLIFLYRFIWQ